MPTHPYISNGIFLLADSGPAKYQCSKSAGDIGPTLSLRTVSRPALCTQQAYNLTQCLLHVKGAS